MSKESDALQEYREEMRKFRDNFEALKVCWEEVEKQQTLLKKTSKKAGEVGRRYGLLNASCKRVWDNLTKEEKEKAGWGEFYKEEDGP